jgi:hypothetical protein
MTCIFDFFAQRASTKTGAVHYSYAENLGQGADVHLIGVEFSKTARNVVGFEVQTLTG